QTGCLRSQLFSLVLFKPSPQKKNLGNSVGRMTEAEVAVESVIFVGQSHHRSVDPSHLESAVILLSLFNRRAQIEFAIDKHGRRFHIADIANRRPSQLL